jgi:L-threonylcarbamoyladenylate synthase
LIVHISSINKLDQWATDIPEYAIKLAREFWPGPMTLILPRKNLAKDFITGGQNNVGLRVPDQPIALALLKKFEELGGQGIAAPSANRFGAVSPTTAQAVVEELGDYLYSDDLVLDGGQCSVGIESTIVACSGPAPRIIRPGFITSEMISSNVNLDIKDTDLGIRASGMLAKHYSPKTKVILGTSTNPGDAFIALNSVVTPENSIRVGAPTNLIEFATHLYALLREVDSKGFSNVVIAPPEGGHLADAIRDRLEKMASW